MLNNLGVQRGTVKLSQHDTSWHEAFLLEKKELEKAFGKALMGVEHVGSSAIPGTKAKPILDLIVGVTSLKDWEQYQPSLREIGYEFKKDLRSTAQHLLFVKGSDENQTHYLKITEAGSDFWAKNIMFRDFLISHPYYAEKYEALKESLLKEHEGNRGPYTEGKDAFIREILVRAGYKGKLL